MMPQGSGFFEQFPSKFFTCFLARPLAHSLTYSLSHSLTCFTLHALPHPLTECIFNASACYVAGQLFSTLVIQALQGLQQLSAYDDNPDMADDTFLLISRGVRYSPGVVYNTQMLPVIVDAAMTGVLVQHRSAPYHYQPFLHDVHFPHQTHALLQYKHLHQACTCRPSRPRDLGMSILVIAKGFWARCPWWHAHGHEFCTAFVTSLLRCRFTAVTFTCDDSVSIMHCCTPVDVPMYCTTPPPPPPKPCSSVWPFA